MVVAMINGKGGVGKTTISIVLARALLEANRSVAIQDDDRDQKTASGWIKNCPDLWSLTATHSADIIVVDTPPRLGDLAVLSAMDQADVIIVPTSPSPADLSRTVETVALLNKQGAADKARILFNAVQRGTMLAANLPKVESELGLPALKNIIYRSQAYQHMVLEGWKALGPRHRDTVLKTAIEIVTPPTKGSHVSKPKTIIR